MVTTVSSQRIASYAREVEKYTYIIIAYGLILITLLAGLGFRFENQIALYIVSAAAALYTFLYHHFVYIRKPTPTAAIIDAVAYTSFIFVLNQITGGLDSLLFFLYFLPIISTRLNLGPNVPIFITFLSLFFVLIEAVLASHIKLGPEGLNFGFNNAQTLNFGSKILALTIFGIYTRSLAVEFSFEWELRKELEKVNQELKETQKAKDEFLFIATHALRSPVVALRGGLSLLAKGTLGKVAPSQKHFIDEISEAGERLSSLVDDLVNVTTLEHPTFALKKETFKIKVLVEEVLKDFNAFFKEKKVELTANLTEHTVLADRKMIINVIYNLIDNAIKFTPSGGKVLVETSEEDGKLIVSVGDTGVGVAESDTPKLFRKFGKAGNVLTSENQSGIGLGLYACKLIMEKHGERIWAESILGGGSKFSFSLEMA